ncbi:SOS response-associated peptidase [Guptibacillus hwajinpoensis]|uniref:Abasic site processing protein n=1 Tax=Guptibacillus hwajinpoensis TaxID=208199 RepID=A0ABU0K3Z1_9BACL|nr:SOS response-associated peptidase [Alkalihalobacillus hemicentroti]MDQ0484087.1 putative SOS response-associated peptidase YedK [Alkalihalobacillus hemicentroti]
MCGRFSLTTELDQLIERFQIEQMSIDDYVPRYNIAPSQQIPAVIKADGGNRLGTLRWGLIPFWAKDASISNKLINARSETAHEKASFKHALKRRRCLLLSDGFYEWKREDNRKVPMHIQVKRGEPFAMAGLWEKWKSGNEAVYTCTILTTGANELMENIHTRMPVILKKEMEDLWLDSDVNDVTILENVMQPFPSKEMNAYEVSTLVNSPTNDEPECIVPIEEI